MNEIYKKEFPTDFTTKSNPVDADLLIIADTEDANEMKKITIGSITADIGDGLIVDGSASATTTYSSNKIVSDNSVQDAALTAGLALKVSKAGDNMTGLFKEAQGADIASATTTDLSAATGNSVTITGTTTITGLGTVQAGTVMKLTFSGILTLTHNATSLILPNAGSNITTAAGDSGIFTSLGSGNWKCLSFQRADGTSLWGVSITGLTEDTTGDMDADFALVYDNSATANRKQKMNVYRASQAESLARSSTTKFVPPAYLPAHTNGTTTKNAADASTTQNIAHGLGVAPKKVRITAMYFGASGAGDNIPVIANTAYNGTTQSSVSFYAIWASLASSGGTVAATFTLNAGGASGTQTGVVTVDATNIIITWTKTNSPTGTYTLLWEANT